MRIDGCMKNVTINEFSRLYKMEEDDKNELQETIKILERDEKGHAVETYMKMKSNWLLSSRDAVFRRKEV